MIIDRIVMNKIFKNNKTYLPTMTITMKKMTIIMKNTYLKIKMKIVMKILYSTKNKNNTSEYTTPESTTSASNASQTEISTISQFVRIPTRVVSPRQNTHDPQSFLDTSSHRNITFNLPTHSDEVVQDETQNITSTRDTFVNE